MKKKNIVLQAAVLLAAAALTAGMPAAMLRQPAACVAYAEGEDEYEYAENDRFVYQKYSDHIAVSDAKSAGDTLEIPAEIDGLPVTEVAIYGFQLCGMKKLILPETMEVIGPYAFSMCESLESVTLPESIKKVRFQSFKDCPKLAEINFPDHLVQTGDFTFDNTPWMDEQRKKDPLVIMNGAVIDGHTCTGDVVIPAGVKYVGSGAFSHNDKITSVVVPAGVSVIEENTFFLCEALTSAELKGATELGYGVFAYCSKLTDLKLSGKLTKINDDVFMDNEATATITFYGSEEKWKQVAKNEEDAFLKRAKMVFDESHQEEPPETVAGDLDGDGACGMADIVLLQKYLLTTGTLTDAQAKLADMNESGTLTASDLTLLKQVVLA